MYPSISSLVSLSKRPQTPHPSHTFELRVPPVHSLISSQISYHTACFFHLTGNHNVAYFTSHTNYNHIYPLRRVVQTTPSPGIRFQVCRDGRNFKYFVLLSAHMPFCFSEALTYFSVGKIGHPGTTSLVFLVVAGKPRSHRDTVNRIMECWHQTGSYMYILLPYKTQPSYI